MGKCQRNIEYCIRVGNVSWAYIDFVRFFPRQRRQESTFQVSISVPLTIPDVFLIRRILKAMERVDKLKVGKSLKQIADEEDTTAEYLSKNLDLAFLSPKILKAIASGQQDPAIAVSHFHSKRLPANWADQEPIFL